MMKPNPEHIGDLKPDPRNARRHNPRNIGMIVDALHEVGFARSIVIDENNRILAGNGTVDAAAEAGIERVQVVEADGNTVIAVRRTGLTPEQKQRLALFDNRAADTADWNPEVLAELAADGVKLDDLFCDDELTAILGEVPIIEGDGGDEFDTTPDDGPTTVQPGEVWALGKHRLMCGDSTKPEDVARLMDGAKADIIFADPPYGIEIVAANGFVGSGEAYDIPFGGVKGRKGDVGCGAAHIRKPFGSKNVRGSIGASNIVNVGKYAPVIGDETTETAVSSWRLMSELYPDAFHVWWGGNYYADTLPASSCWLVWDKQNTGNFADVELAWTNRATASRLFSHMWNGMLRESERGVRRVHPTQKPVALAEWVIDKFKVTGTMLDPFAGSGMSLIAAHRYELEWRGLELSPDYCDVIIKRYKAETGEDAVRVYPDAT